MREPGAIAAAVASVRNAHGQGHPRGRGDIEAGDAAGGHLPPDAVLHVRDHDVVDRAPGVLVLFRRRRRRRTRQRADPAEHWRPEDAVDVLAGGEGGAGPGAGRGAGDVPHEEADGAGELCGLCDWG